MVRLGDFEVVVNSPGVGPLPEFDDPDAAAILQNVNGPGIVKYIQATADTHFTFKFTILPEHSIDPIKDIVFDVYVDDNAPMGSRIFLSQVGANGSSDTFEGREFLKGARDWKLERMRFGPLHLTDDVDADMQSDQVSAIGTLKIKVWEYQRTGQHKCKAEETTRKRDTFSEEDFKDSTSDMLVNMDDPETLNRTASTAYDGKRIGGAPQATMILKYRSRGALQKLGLIPKSPSPIPLERRDIDSLNPDELRERLRRAEANIQAAAVKTEEQNDTKPGIKRRVSSSAPEAPASKRMAKGASNENGGDRENPVVLDSDDKAARASETITLSDSE